MRKLLILVLFSFLVVILLIVFKENLLVNISEGLMHQDTLKAADAILVLSGSGTANRIDEATRLFGDGFGKWLIISGTAIFPGVFSFNLLKTRAVKLGVPEEKIVVSEIEDEISTWGEGITNLRLMRMKKINSFIIVTSDFHSKRSYEVYKKLISEFGYDMRFFVYPAKDPEADMTAWWEKRRGRVPVFLEYLKLVNFYFEH